MSDRDFMFIKSFLEICDYSEMRCFKYVIGNGIFYTVFTMSKIIFWTTKMYIFIAKPVTPQWKLYFRIERFSYGTVFIYGIQVVLCMFLLATFII